MKKMILLGFCFCLALCLCACSEAEATEPEFVLTYAENQAQNYPTSLGGERFANGWFLSGANLNSSRFNTPLRLSQERTAIFFDTHQSAVFFYFQKYIIDHQKTTPKPNANRT